ncbi:MAG TPA: HDOD domain-containing protein [Desulfatiglandales bacterium]|nr:HDOD domain-containing protein [Desulfatiglandales bacterium]
MKIECQGCDKVYNIPDDRLPKGEKLSFPCPVCKTIIELDLRPEGKEQKDAKAKQMLRGEALKKKILRSINDLPPMPETVMKARQIMNDEHSSFKELAEVLETDQAIAAKVLRIANSAYYGMAGKISSIKHASVVLGFKVLGELITIAGASEVLGSRLSGYKLEAGALWQHSLGVAQGAKVIANRKLAKLGEDAFAAGLIHDVGKLVLDPYVLDREKLFDEFMNDGQQSFLQAEENILGFGHPEIASELCKQWNIPKILVIAIQHHHRPSMANGDELAYIVHMADAIAMMSGLGTGIDGMLYEMEEGAMNFLGLQEEDLNTIMAEVAEFVMKVTT